MNEDRWLTRRTVLAAAAVTAAGGASLATLAVDKGRLHLAPAPASQARATGRPSPASGGGSSSAGPRAADWAVLRGELPPGALICPGDPGYGRSRLQFDPRFDRLRPAGIAYCRSAGDVSACIAFARRFAVPVAARSTDDLDGRVGHGGCSGPSARLAARPARGDAGVRERPGVPELHRSRAGQLAGGRITARTTHGWRGSRPLTTPASCSGSGRRSRLPDGVAVAAGAASAGRSPSAS